MGANLGGFMLEFVFNFLFPTKCGFCGKIHKDGICPKCNYKLKKIAQCEIVKVKNFYFDYHVYLFHYQGEIRNKLIDLKFNDKPYLAKTFINFLIKNRKICGFLKKYDIIMPVPMYIKKKNQRGYNQAELIAKCLANKIGIKQYEDDILLKVLDTKKQSSLNKQERMQNLIGAYKIQKTETIQNKSILLVDDILTTGSTANECCKMLKQIGAKNICVLTIAKD